MEGCTAGGGRHAAPTQKRDIYLPGGGDFQPGFMAEQGDCAGSQLLGSPSARPPVSCIRRDAGWGLQATWAPPAGPEGLWVERGCDRRKDPDSPRRLQVPPCPAPAQGVPHAGSLPEGQQPQKVPTLPRGVSPSESTPPPQGLSSAPWLPPPPHLSRPKPSHGFFSVAPCQGLELS